MRGDIYFYRKGFRPKKEQRHAFSFPQSTAELSFNSMKKFQMEPALKRYAQCLINNLDPKGEKLVGIALHCINFTMLYK